MKKQVYLTPAEGKRLIAKSIANDEKILKIAREHTVALASGTTNIYVCEELFKKLGLPETDLSTIYSGVFMGPDGTKKPSHRDIVIRKGEFLPELNMFDIGPELTSEDLIMKGGNALYLPLRQVGVFIGNPEFGKLSPIVTAVYGRRAKLILPIGLEKRVDAPVTEIERFVNDPEVSGLRFAYAPGEPYTELDAFSSLGLSARLLGAGGVAGFEGSVIIGIEGPAEAMEKAEELLKAVKGEKRFGIE